MTAPATPAGADPGHRPWRSITPAAWRAAASCLHPRMVLLSFLPLLLACALVLTLGFFFWEDAVAGLRSLLERWQLLSALLDWLDKQGLQGLRSVLAPLLLVALALPWLVLLCLLLVGCLIGPAIVRWVASKRHAALQPMRGAGALQVLGWALAAALPAALALIVTLPLWLLPPLALLVPAAIWGWVTARVMGFVALAGHAGASERQQLLRQRRGPLLAMGLACGVLAVLPSLMWVAGGAAALILAPLLVLVSVWLYTLVFAFAAAWFAHYLLGALHALRASVPMPQHADAPA